LITEPYYPIEDEPIYIDDHGQRLVRIPSHTHHAQPSHRPDQIELDYYQHPEKRWNPGARYNRAHDVYSLGCVLLELGLWETLASVVEVEDEDFERVKRGFQSLTMRLDG
jgi:serine/threonine protein kinase